MIVRRSASCLSACILAWTATAAAGVEPAAALPRAVELLELRQPAAAFDLLRVEEHRLAGSADFDYLLGISAMDAGHVTHAILALERVVAVQPGNALARAELARAYLAAGETDNARAQLLLARRARVPEAAAAAIDRVLGALDATATATAASPKVSGHVEFGIGWDSNVNSANNAGQFAIPAFGGLLFQVAPGDQRQRDAFAYAGAGVDLQSPLSASWKVVASANGRTVLNRRVDEMNLGLVDGTLGLSHTAGSQTRTVALQSSTAWVSGSAYRRANGVSGQWQWRPDGVSQWSTFVQWARQAYSGQGERNADRSVLGMAYARGFAASGTLGYGSLYGVEERARQEGYGHFGHRGFGVRLGVEQSLAAGTTVLAEWRLERRAHGGTEPLFLRQRIDRQSDLALGLRWSPVPGWFITPGIRHSAARSSVQLHDHERTVAQVAVRKELP